MALQSLTKFPHRWVIGLVIAATALTGTTIFYGLSRFIGGRPTASAIATPTATKVTALGRLEPQTEVINLSAPLTLDGDPSG